MSTRNASTAWSTFDPNLPNPELQGRTINGQPVKGAFVLVNTPGHPERGLRPEHFKLFAPRVGVAYRLSSKTVIRTGGGIFFIPATVQFPEGPYGNVVNYLTHVMVGTVNNNATPQNTLSDPYPGRLPGSAGTQPDLPEGAARREQSRPVALRRLRLHRAVELLGAASADVRAWRWKPPTPAFAACICPRADSSSTRLPQQYLSMGAALNTQVDNPLYGLIQNGPFSQPKVQQGLLLMPFPQYTSLPDPGGYRGNSIYHSLQVKAEKRFSAGGSLLAAYTFSKVISDVETLTTWLDSANGVSGIQNWNDFRSERALSSFDSRQRLTVSYVVDLPFGKGKRLLSGAHGIGDRLVSGWGINGVSTFQQGFPLGFTATPNQLSGFNYGLRPNVVAGCDAVKSGAAQDRLNQWFNTVLLHRAGRLHTGQRRQKRRASERTGHQQFQLRALQTNADQRAFQPGVPFGGIQPVQPRAVRAAESRRDHVGDQHLRTDYSQINDPRLIQLALRLRY